MPSPVPARPTPATLTSRRVGQPLSSAHGRRWAQDLNFLRAYAVPPIVSARFHTGIGGTATNADAWALYQRTPGVMVLRVAVRLHTIDTNVGAGALSISHGTDPTVLTAATIVGPSTPFDGSTEIILPNWRLRARDTYVAYVLVGGRGSPGDPDYVAPWSTSDVTAIRVRYARSSGQTTGLYSLDISEVPLSNVDPVSDPTNEAGANEAEPDVRNRLYQGVASTRGILRFWSELDVARSQVRRHVQVIARQLDGISCDSATLTQLTWPTGIGATEDPRWYVRARRLYDSATPNRYTFAVLYSYDPTYATLTNSYVRCNAVGSGTTHNTLQLTDTGGALALGTVAATVPCDGTDQLAQLYFDARTESASGGSTAHDPVAIFALALIEAET